MAPTRRRAKASAQRRGASSGAASPPFVLTVAVAATIGVVAALLWLAQPSDPTGEIAARLAGERWYAVVYRHVPIGHYRTWHGRSSEGEFEFRTELRFALARETPTRIEERLVFGASPPHPFLRGEHVAAGGETHTRVTIEGGTARIAQQDKVREREVAFDFMLADYLAVEHWLSFDAPQPGATRSARSIDFDRLEVVDDLWRLQALEPSGAVVVKAGRDEVRIQLARDHAPLGMAMGNLFSIRKVADAHTARAWENEAPLFASAAHRVPVDRAIANPQALRRIILAIEPASQQTSAWLGGTADARLNGSIAPQPVANADETAQATAATVSFPADDERLRKLAERAVAGADTTRDKAAALTRFVSRFLRYSDATGPRTVFDTLRERRGDCTEFADFYTTLGRAVGLPTRTVVGLAYRPSEAPNEAGVFAPHAWNEVTIDGAWHSVDPTWGQAPADATHLPLPPATALDAIAQLPTLRFRVVAAEYQPAL